MKRLILIFSLVVGLTTQLLAQSFPCDITSTGVQLRSASGTPIAHIYQTGVGVANFVITNQGVGQNNGDPCAYAVGKVNVRVGFVPSTYVSYYFRYNGPTSFTTPKYSWTYNPATSILLGVNTAPITSDFSGAEIVDVPIAGVAPGTTLLPVTMQIVQSASGDNTNNNAFDMPVTVLAGSGGVLPIALTEFDGNAANCSTNITWKTSNETNLNKFEVELSSDGNIFTSVGTVKPSAANADKSYQFNWKQGSGKAFYRLKIIDNDGSFTYSKIIPVVSNCNEKKFVKIFPNPVITNQLLKVTVTGYDTNIKGDLYSATGQFVKSFVLKNGNNDLTVENLSQGFYTLRISENGTQTEVFKLNILR
jgi:Secretion system C-terminal sorting domain